MEIENFDRNSFLILTFMLRADIDFKVKQFWSNEVNKISAEVYAKDTKKPLVKVSPIVINKA